MRQPRPVSAVGIHEERQPDCYQNKCHRCTHTLNARQQRTREEEQRRVDATRRRESQEARARDEQRRRDQRDRDMEWGGR